MELGFLPLIILAALGTTLGLLFAMVAFRVSGARQTVDALRALETTGVDGQNSHQAKIDQRLEQLKQEQLNERKNISQTPISTKLTQAGIDSPLIRVLLLALLLLLPGVTALLLGIIIYGVFQQTTHALMSIPLGFIIGFSLPRIYIDNRIRYRQQEIKATLPLLIDGFVAGVSSSLSLGACVTNLVQIATITEKTDASTALLFQVERFIDSGMSFEEALVHVGNTTGVPEARHTFMVLAQCAIHGGAVLDHLAQLSDSLMLSRRFDVEEQIIKLPVKATAPLALVFAGFFARVYGGIFVTLMNSAFSDAL